MNDKTRKLPKWMGAPTPSPVIKHTTTTPKSSFSRSSSTTAPTSAKRHCKLFLYLPAISRTNFFFVVSFEGESNAEVNESSNMSGKFEFFIYFRYLYYLYLDVQSPATPSETKSPGKVLSRIPTTKSFDSDSGDGFDSVTPKTPTPKKGI
jgi:hypothetical protein